MKLDSVRIQKIIIVILAVLSILPVIGIAFYNHPSVDDFGYSKEVYQVVRDGGNLGDAVATAADTSMKMMNTWQGLYSSAFLLALQPGVWGDGYYWITTLIMVVSIFVGTMFLTRSLMVYCLEDQKKNWVWVSILLAFFFVQTMPYPVEGLYWYNGAMNYLFFWAMLLVVVSQWIILCVKEKSVVRILLITPLAFVLSGGNHVSAFAGLMIELAFGLYLMIRKKKYLAMLPFAVGLAGFLWNVTSNGTRIRRSTLNHQGNAIKTMIASVVRQMMILNEWVNFALILLLILLTPFLYQLVKQSIVRIHYRWKTLLVMFLGFAVLILGMWCVPYQAIGDFGSGRLRNMLFMTFVVLFLILYGYILGIIAQSGVLENVHIGGLRKRVLGLVLIPVAMILLMMFGGTNTDYGTGVEAIREYPSAKQYHQEMNARLEVYLDDSISDAVVEPFTQKPMLLFYDDIRSDERNWKNLSLAEYYKKGTVRKSYDE